MMEERKQILIDPNTKYSLTTLTEFLNENFEKNPVGRNNFSKDFTISDVQSYVRRGHLPLYFKENSKIEILRIKDETLPKIKLYTLKEKIVE